MQQPSVGSIVHYVSYGTPGGEYPSVCRAAIVTEVKDPAGDAAGGIVRLCVLNPEGLYFTRNVVRSEDEHRGGTWHWPDTDLHDAVNQPKVTVHITAPSDADAVATALYSQLGRRGR